MGYLMLKFDLFLNALIITGFYVENWKMKLRYYQNKYLKMQKLTGNGGERSCWDIFFIVSIQHYVGGHYYGVSGNFGCCIFLYLPTPPLGQDVTQGQFLSGV